MCFSNTTLPQLILCMGRPPSPNQLIFICFMRHSVCHTVKKLRDDVHANNLSLTDSLFTNHLASNMLSYHEVRLDLSRHTFLYQYFEKKKLHRLIFLKSHGKTCFSVLITVVNCISLYKHVTVANLNIFFVEEREKL